MKLLLDVNKNTRKVVLLTLFTVLSQFVDAQFIDCSKYYFHVGPSIYSVDPITNNQTLISITMPSGSSGLAIANNYFSGPSPTFYTTKSGNYYYYNGSTWVNTGHFTGNTAAVNPGGAGPYIYNLNGPVPTYTNTMVPAMVLCL